MPDLLTSLGSGVLLAVISFVMLYRLANFNAKTSGFISAGIVLSLYIVYAILNWPGGDVFSIHLAIFGVVPYMLGIVSHYREQALSDEQRKKWFHWIPAMFFAFFVVVVTVNMTLVTLSTNGMSSTLLQWLLPKEEGGEFSSQFPGVISHDYQEKESLYNAYLARLAVQKERAWKIKQGWLLAPVENKDAIFQIEARDKAGDILTGLNATIKFLRPSNYKMDKEFIMQEVMPGIYQQAVVFDAAGNWDVVILLRKDDAVHEIRGDTFVKDAAE